MGPLQSRSFQHHFFPRDPTTKPKKYKYSLFYNPYDPRAPPSDKIVQLAERIVALTTEEWALIGPALRDKIRHPKMQPISTEGIDLSPQGGDPGAAKAKEKKAEKTTFDAKLEKFDAATKIKVIKESRAFTNLGLKEAKDLVEKAPGILKLGFAKEANDIMEKIKAAECVAIME